MFSTCSCHGGAGCDLARTGVGFLGLGDFGLLVAGGLAGARGSFASFHLAMQFGAFFDSHPIGTNIAVNAGSIPDVDAVGAFQFALDTAAHDDFTGDNIGLHRCVRTDREDGILKINLALDSAVNEEILTTGDFTLDLDALTQAGNRVRRDLCGT